MAKVSTFLKPASVMRRCLFATVAVIAGLGATNAGAAQWWYVNQGQDRVMLIDVASIASDRGVLTYWNTQVIADGADDGVRMVKSLMRADCAKSRGGWTMIVRYDRDDRQIDVDSLAKPAMAAVTPNTLGQAELDFVCATPDAREAAGGFALEIDPRTFADALITAPSDETPRAVHDRLAQDPSTPVVRSAAAGPETFGTRQSIKAGQPLVPPRDYAKGTDIPKAEDYPPSSSGEVYDVTFEGLEQGQMVFEVRGYDADDLIHPASGQTERFPAALKTITIRDLALQIEKVTPEAITYRVTVEKGDTPR
jgi:hypothetical protein